MIDNKVKRYINEIKITSDYSKRMHMLVEGIQRFFKFSRIIVFSLSPFSSTTEIMISKERDQYLDYSLRTAVSEHPNFVASALQRQTVFVNDLENVNMKYGSVFDLSSFWIVPIYNMNSIYGFVLLDRYTGSKPCDRSLFDSLETYLSITSQFLNPFLTADENISLSKRQVEILRYAAEGYSNKEIADILGISEFTVRDYFVSATNNLNALNRTHAVAKAMRIGYIN